MKRAMTAPCPHWGKRDRLQSYAWARARAAVLLALQGLRTKQIAHVLRARPADVRRGIEFAGLLRRRDFYFTRDDLDFWEITPDEAQRLGAFEVQPGWFGWALPRP